MRLSHHLERERQRLKDLEAAVKQRVIDLAKQLDVDLSDPAKNELLTSLVLIEATAGKLAE